MLVVEKEANILSTLHEIANCVKNGTRKVVSSKQASRSLQCRPHLLSVKFENLVHSIFRNENSALEINVSHFSSGSPLHPPLVRIWLVKTLSAEKSLNFLPPQFILQVWTGINWYGCGTNDFSKYSCSN